MDTITAESTSPAKNKGGRPPKPPSEADVEKVLASPAGQAAIAAAAQSAVAQILSTMQDTRVAASVPVDDASGVRPDDKAFAEKLALAIAQLTDQGSGRPRLRVSPEIMAQRKAAREEMVSLLAKTKALGHRPLYRVIAKTYLEEVFVEPFRLDPVSKASVPVEIFWNGIPNECMRPMDETSKSIYELYLASTGGLTSLVKSADSRGLSITPGGLVIKGESNPRRTVGNLADSSNGSPRDAFGLQIVTQFNPNAQEVRVLGTVAAPARQHSYGSPAAAPAPAGA